MKNIKYYFVILVSALTVFSCTDFLDIRPEKQILLEDYWKKESDVEAVIMSCYRRMQEDDFMKRVIVWGELRSDNMVARNTNDSRQEYYIHDVNILPNNSYSSWGAFYSVINYCNTILEYAPRVVDEDPNFTESDLRAKEAEVLALRALCYFYLVRTFRDVPLSLTATISDDQVLDIAQSPPSVVLDKIIEDLLIAERSALTVFPTNAATKGRITQDGVRAILADVYLWKGEYEKCVEYCDKLINATTTTSIGTSLVEIPRYNLNLGYNYSQNVFDIGSSSESIFELRFTTEKRNEAVTDFYGNNGNKSGFFRANRTFVSTTDVFDEDDVRQQLSIYIPSKPSSSSTDEYSIFKYLGTSLGEYTYMLKSTTANWIFYRITDIMLMKAEALVQLNRSEQDRREALRLVNKTYMRAHPSLAEEDSLVFESNSTPATLERLVLLERQRELMFEGKRWFDLVRLSERTGSTEQLVNYVLNKYTSNSSTIAFKLSVMNAIYMPINSGEIEVNPLLEQNPYYDTSSSIEKN